MKDNVKTIVVIGAAGGVGRHTVRQLRVAGYRVTAVDRKDPGTMPELADLVADSGVTWHRLHIDREDMGGVFQGAFGVVNAAGDVGLSESYPEVVGSNVVGVDRLYGAAAEASVEHVVHISAGSLYVPGHGLRTETDPLESTSDYARSKLDAEHIFVRSTRSHPRWTILRPSYVYGPGCTSMAAGLVTLPPILGDFLKYQPGFRGGARTTWCHVEDLARAVVQVMGNPEAYGEIYNVADNTPQGAGECIMSITEAYGLEVGLVVPLPSSLLVSASRLVTESARFEQGLRTMLRQLWRRVLRRHNLDSPLRPKVDKHAASHMVTDLVLDNRKLVGLGWRPLWPSFTSGISSTIDWYQRHGWVPVYDPAHLEQLRLNAQPLYYSFEQTLTGSLQVSEAGYEALPELSLPDRHGELVERLELSGDVRAEEGAWNKVVVELEVTLRSLVRLKGELDGRIWVGGISGRAATLRGTYDYDWFRQRLTLDFGFQDEHGQSFRSTLVAFGPRLSGLSGVGGAGILPSEFHGELYDRHGECLGEVELTSVVTETLVSMLLGLR